MSSPSISPMTASLKQSEFHSTCRRTSKRDCCGACKFVAALPIQATCLHFSRTYRFFFIDRRLFNRSLHAFINVASPVFGSLRYWAYLLPARRSAYRGLCCGRVSVCPSVCHTPVLCLNDFKPILKLFLTFW